MPTTKVWITGQGEVIASLRRVNWKLNDSITPAMMSAAILLKEESQKLVPVEFGELKDSAYVTVRKRGFFIEATVGYAAPYAAYVHEAVGMKLKGQPRPSGMGKYWDPNGRPKFLEEPSRRMRPELFALMANKVKAI